jgi:hypothetical protein
VPETGIATPAWFLPPRAEPGAHTTLALDLKMETAVSLTLETLAVHREGSVLFVEILAPPMNLLGPELQTWQRPR